MNDRIIMCAVLIFVLFGSTTMSAYRSNAEYTETGQRRVAPVVRVQIASMYYSALAILGISPKRLLNTEASFRLDTRDSTLCLFLDSLLRDVRLEHGRRFKSNVIDARLVCVAHHSDGRRDTLSFGGFNMKLNRRSGFLQPWPLLRLATYLPADHQNDIKWFLDSTWIKSPAEFPKYGYDRQH